MDSKELLKKVRQIEIKSRRLSDNLFGGEYLSTFKGRGMTFSEVRKYEFGDDIRSIDWNVTARYNEPFIKVFEEERELTLMLLIDVSGSKNFGTQKQIKQELVTELSAVIAFSAIQNNDKIGIIFFSDIVEKFIPPKKGKSHILRIIRELIAFEPKNKKTDIAQALVFFNNLIKKRSVCFILSDFMNSGFDAPLKMANKKHDLVAIRIHDKREEQLPNIGLIQMKDAETDSVQWVDTSSKSVRDSYHKNYLENEKIINHLFKSNGVDTIQLRTDEDFIKPLIQFFKRRVK